LIKKAQHKPGIKGKTGFYLKELAKQAARQQVTSIPEAEDKCPFDQ